MNLKSSVRHYLEWNSKLVAKLYAIGLLLALSME